MKCARCKRPSTGTYCSKCTKAITEKRIRKQEKLFGGSASKATLDDNLEAYSARLFEGKKPKKPGPGTYANITDEELLQSRGEKRPRSEIKDMLDRIEARYPGTKRSFAKAIYSVKSR